MEYGTSTAVGLQVIKHTSATKVISDTMKMTTDSDVDCVADLPWTMHNALQTY